MCLEWILRQDVEIEERDDTGRTHVQLAAAVGGLKILQRLAALNFDIKIVNDLTRNACHGAAAGGHLEVLQWLIDQQVDPTTLCTGGWTPFSIAVAKGHLDCARFLEERYPSCLLQNVPHGYSSLTLAAVRGQVMLTEYLIREGADWNAQTDDSQKTPSDQGLSTLYRTVTEKEIETARVLLQHGADPNLAKCHGITPLLEASQSAPLALCRHVLVQGISKYDAADR